MQLQPESASKRAFLATPFRELQLGKMDSASVQPRQRSESI